MVENGENIWMFNERGELLITRLSPQGFQEISRTKLLEPTKDQLNQRGGVCWSHPAFANRTVLFARNDVDRRGQLGQVDREGGVPCAVGSFPCDTQPPAFAQQLGLFDFPVSEPPRTTSLRRSRSR